MKDPEGLENYYTVNLHAPLQIVDDWNREWITEIKVIDQSENCTVETNEVWVHLFNDPWEQSGIKSDMSLSEREKKSAKAMLDEWPWEKTKFRTTTFR